MRVKIGSTPERRALPVLPPTPSARIVSCAGLASGGHAPVSVAASHAALDPNGNGRACSVTAWGGTAKPAPDSAGRLAPIPEVTDGCRVFRA